MRRPEQEHRVAWQLLTQWGVGPAIRRRDTMHIDIVMLNIVIALGIIGLIARAADGGK
jgi:hypothetical protein